MSETIAVRMEGRTAWLTLNRPPLNVLDIAMMRELDAALARVAAECDILVLQGAGPKGFSAGAEVADHVPERVAGMLGAFHGVFRRLARAECVTIAAVSGLCLGGAMELATFCDFVVATEAAKFGQPEIKLACYPPVAMVTFPQLCGMRAAMDLIFTGRTVDGREAQRMGLVTRLAPEGELAAGVEKLLGELRGLSGTVLRLTRKTLWRLHADAFEKQLDEAERIYLNELMKTKDAPEGIRAFLEKRAPVWQGR
ncbi:MAG: enoyl-CoA hydratase/isomerase family protein [Acidobacteriia bacterium]|nr:enoyl-CoA hydratase/isomerase family protein [Terriglobia bacterium]